MLQPAMPGLIRVDVIPVMSMVVGCIPLTSGLGNAR